MQQIPKGQSITAYTLEQAKKSGLDAFATVSQSALEKNYNLWVEHLPEVKVHYAMKCNPHPTIVQTLRNLGANFDCASPAEVRIAMKAGAAREEIIYANPQKTADSIKIAYDLDVSTFTFDSEAELIKMIENTPSNKRGRFVLRLLPPDESHSVCKFGVKFGANPFEAERIVRLAMKMKQQKDNFDLVGVSFHVGSGCFSTESFRLAVLYCGRVAKLARELGHPMSLMDIGGGYMTKPSMKHYEHEAHEHGEQVTFEETAAVLRVAIDEVRPIFDNLKIIAEPGRFFAGDCMCLAIRVFGRRVLFDYKDATPEMLAKEPLHEDEVMKIRNISEIKYYVGDGMYGWFNAIMFDHVFPYLKFYRNEQEIKDAKIYTSHIFGPTCDSMDCIMKEQQIPLLQIDDWIVAEAFGAYTWAASTEFNGIPLVNVAGVVESK
ncbi:Ornithine_decarboxylase [Hexamita inflata]|uniref:ornithine decarboxylase n=1 Tax=Hexamita inflata TaxID=28002 RepID=A0AA86T8Y0_9EUKA|nr:Ornithine decarboxylase [Hexamita inflata]CAI9924737.1 Ornithine decarboxylase [Hexamita inflata]